MDLSEMGARFDNLDPSCRSAIWEESIVKDVVKGSALCREGDVCSHLPLVVYGSLRIFKAAENGREVTLYEIEPGSSCILSAAGILKGASFPATAMAESDSRVLLVPASTVKRLYETDPGWRDFILSLYTSRVSSMIHLVEDVLFRRLDERLMEYITSKSADGILHATHLKIAEELGSSREVISRILKDLEHRGLITMERGTIILSDVFGDIVTDR